MSKLATTCFTAAAFIGLLGLSFNLMAEEVTPAVATTETTPKKQEPRIISKFFSAEAVEAIPKLKPLNNINPGFNKILIRLEGFPKQKEIIFEVKRPLSAKPEEYQRISIIVIQEDGSYLVDNKNKMDYIVGSSRGFRPGERMIARFRTSDGSIEKVISGIPNPAVFKDKEGNVAMRAELLSESPTIYKIDFPTMAEGEEYNLLSTSIGQTIKAKPIYSSAKPLRYSPKPKGKSDGGKSVLKIKRKSGETYTLELPWGTALEVYKLGGKCYPYHN